jgi:hypothetical protein
MSTLIADVGSDCIHQRLLFKTAKIWTPNTSILILTVEINERGCLEYERPSSFMNNVFFKILYEFLDVVNID